MAQLTSREIRDEIASLDITARRYLSGKTDLLSEIQDRLANMPSQVHDAFITLPDARKTVCQLTNNTVQLSEDDNRKLVTDLCHYLVRGGAPKPGRSRGDGKRSRPFMQSAYVGPVVNRGRRTHRAEFELCWRLVAAYTQATGEDIDSISGYSYSGRMREKKTNPFLDMLIDALATVGAVKTKDAADNLIRKYRAVQKARFRKQ